MVDTAQSPLSTQEHFLPLNGFHSLPPNYNLRRVARAGAELGICPGSGLGPGMASAQGSGRGGAVVPWPVPSEPGPPPEVAQNGPEHQCARSPRPTSHSNGKLQTRQVPRWGHAPAPHQTQTRTRKTLNQPHSLRTWCWPRLHTERTLTLTLETREDRQKGLGGARQPGN